MPAARAGFPVIAAFIHRLSSVRSGAWSRSRVEKTLDKAGTDPYATPSMSSPSAREMLARGRTFVHVWTERGDLKDAGEEEGREEGNEEEEVSGPGTRGGGPITLPVLS